MNKRIFFLIAGVLGFIIIFLLIVIMLVQQKKVELANPLPTEMPTPSPTPIFDIRPSSKPLEIQGEQLVVVNTEPTDGAKNVFLDTDIVITFNRISNGEDYIFSFTPNVESTVNYDVSRKIAYIQFKELLKPNTQYTFKINTYTQLPKTITFTTGEATGAAKIKF